MKKFIHDQKGNVMVLFAFALVCLLGFAALAIDVGYMWTARHQMQCAVDAATLAGASGLITSKSHATNEAIKYAGLNTCMNTNVQITSADVTFPTPSRIQVQASRTIPLFFARVLGIATADVSAMAAAEYGNINGTDGLKPWAVPDLEWNIGDLVTIKASVLGAPSTNPGFFYPIDFPPINRGTPVPGADAYRTNIIDGSQDMVHVGDELVVEPGNMVGPTIQGVNDMINFDAYARWDGSGVTNSAYSGYSSPRIIIIPLYDPDFPPDSGKNSVIVTKLAAFFVENMVGQTVHGRFIEIITSGNVGGGSSYLKGVKLVL